VTAIQVTAAGLRSDDSRGLLFNIYGGTLSGGTPDVAAVKAGMTSRTGLIEPESVTLLTSETPQRIQMTLKKQPAYEIFTNDTVEVQLPGSLFTGNTPCAKFAFHVQPSPGRVTSNAPVGTTEIDVNNGDIQFTVTLQHDFFMIPGVVTRTTPRDGISVSYALGSTAPSRTIIVTIARNDTFNLRFGESERLQFAFPKEIMRTRLVPTTSDLGFESDITLNIDGALPFVTARFDNADGVMYAEDVWDGTATVVLAILGDSWIVNNSLWIEAATKPTLSPSRPIQKYGFEYFLNKGILPLFNVSRREVKVTFPAMKGFTLSNVPVTSLEVKGFDNLATERTAIQPVSIRVLKAREASVFATWSGPAFNRHRPLTEADVRRSGVSFTVALKYNIFATPPNVITLKEMFVRSTAGAISTEGMAATVTNLTHVTITLPAQGTYDISRNDIVNLTIPAASTETRVQPFKPSAGFLVETFSGASTCDVFSPITLDEAAIRDVSGPPVNVSIKVASGVDTFCYSAPAIAQLQSSVQFSISDAPVTFNIAQQTSTSIVFELQKNANYEISDDNFMSFVVPKELMCSLEYCKGAKFFGSNFDPAYMQIAIRTTPGTIIAQFPNITEADMRVNSYTVTLQLIGDTFKLETGQTESTSVPPFEVTPADPNQRGFLASIRRGTLLRWNAVNQTTATLTIPANATYDAAATEIVNIVIGSTATSSGLQPISRATSMVITALQGRMFASILPNITIREADIINGSFAFTVTLENEIFQTPAGVASDLRSRFNSPTATSTFGVVTQLGTYLADAAVTLNPLRTTATIAFRPSPAFDILQRETIILTFGSGSIASGVAPRNNTYIINVDPDPGLISVAGSATFAGTIDVVNGGLTYVLSLTNDLWRNDMEFDRDHFCLLAPQCSVILNQDNRRDVTVIFDRYSDFVLTVNRTYSIVLPGTYFRTNSTPQGNATLLIYVTSGIVAWSFERALPTMTEDQVREGSLPRLIAGVSGDKLSVAKDVRAALIAGVSCSSPGGNGTNPYGFCARAATIFQGLDFTLGSGNRVMRLQLQGDDLYDIYVPETVTLYLGATAFQSRLAPNRTFSLTFTVQPRAGQFFVSGTLTGLTQRDVTEPARAAQVKITVTLHGERWVPNVTDAVSALTDALKSTSQSTTRGFMAFKEQIFNPVASGSLDNTHRVLTLQFVPVTRFAVFDPEFITITVPSSAVLSAFNPALASKASGFAMNKALGQISYTPARIHAAEVRQGLNVTVHISGATWRPLQIAGFSLVPYVTTKSSPIEEPNGFAVHRQTLLSLVTSGPDNIQPSTFIVPLKGAAAYDLIRPELVYLGMGTGWTVENVDTDPSRLSIRIDPDYPPVEVVVDVGGDDGQLDLVAWKAAVANAIGVQPGEIVVLPGTPVPEPNIPQPSPFRRVSLRVSYSAARDPTADPELPPLYDNAAAKLITGLDKEFSQRVFNASASFVNSTPPSDAFWAALAAGRELSDSGPAVGASTIWLLSFGGFIILVFFGVWVYIKANKGRNKTSLRWAPSSGARAQDLVKDADGHVAGEEDEASLKRTAEAYYGGQRAEVPVLRANGATERALEHHDPGKRSLGIAGASFRATVKHRVDDDDIDEPTALAVPLDLCARQADAKRKRDEELGISTANETGKPVFSSRYEAPSLVDRMGRPGPRPDAPRPSSGSGVLNVPSLLSTADTAVLFPDEVEALRAQREAQAQAELNASRKTEFFNDAPYRAPHRSRFAVGDHTSYALL